MIQFNKMWSIRLVGVFILVSPALGGPTPKLHPDTGLKIDEFLEKYGYPLESHDVQTEDGYILTMHRIPHGVNNESKIANGPKPAVLLMHGLLSCSMDFVNIGPEKALGLRLADEGFDVWIGNQRGNTNGRRHITLDPVDDEVEFFDFSFHEIGYYDVAAKIDYILMMTGQEQISYVGHSQGTTAYFALMASRPEYNEKIRGMIALAPVAFMEHISGPLPRWLADNEDLMNKLFEEFKVHDLLPHYDILDEFAKTVCANESVVKGLCAEIIFMFAGYDPEQFDEDFLSVIVSNDPAGASAKQVQHYIQEVNSANFCWFDYGEDENIKRYGQKTPPNYNVSQITTPVILHYSLLDWMTAPEDVKKLAGFLPNVNLKLVPYTNFSHIDFIWAIDINILLNDDVMEEIKLSWT